MLTSLLRIYTYVHNIFYYSRYCLKHSNRSGWVVSPSPSDEGLNSPLLPSSYEASLHDVVVFLISSHTRHKYDPLAPVLLFCLILDSLQANYLRNRSSDEIGNGVVRLHCGYIGVCILPNDVAPGTISHYRSCVYPFVAP